MSKSLSELTKSLIPPSDFNLENDAQLDVSLEKIENLRLLKLAESRNNSTTTSFEDFIIEEGFSMEELEELSERVEFE